MRIASIYANHSIGTICQTMWIENHMKNALLWGKFFQTIAVICRHGFMNKYKWGMTLLMSLFHLDSFILLIYNWINLAVWHISWRWYEKHILVVRNLLDYMLDWQGLHRSKIQMKNHVKNQTNATYVCSSILMNWMENNIIEYQYQFTWEENDIDTASLSIFW